MFPNCKKCMFYDKEHDDFCREDDDELDYDGSFPDDHYCIRFRDGIPQNVWRHIKKCPHYVKDFDV